MKKSWIGILLSLFLALAFLGGCSKGGTAEKAQVPELRIRFSKGTCHTPMQVALQKGEAFKDWGVYFKPVVPNERYELIKGEKKVADLVIVPDTGVEGAINLMAQGQLDVALTAIIAYMTGIDRGVPMKIISPLNCCGFALALQEDSQINNWQEFLDLVRRSSEPVKIGACRNWTPTLAFDIIFKQNGLKTTWDPNDRGANILWVDLKSGTNFIPALASKQVLGFVSSQPEPQKAEADGVGKVVAQIQDVVPREEWPSFPCCVIGATDMAIRDKKEALTAFLELWHKTTQWCKQNPEEYNAIVAQWTGLPLEIARKADETVIYQDKPDAAWLKGAGNYLDALNREGVLTGKLKGKKLDEVKGELFDFSMLPKK
ncbi:MAG TPA: ABC transporter substrate-binding protein [Moorella mulderi]|nr:ABC transporter substrate-binding protein [Moorella mulderi]